jgi:hypothetical protein
MKILIASALITLSLIAAMAAFDSKTFWDQQDRSHY